MIPFFDLAAQQDNIKHEIDKRIANVLSHGKYILGPEVSELEERLCDYTGAEFCITCANGTDALQISLMAIGVGPGDEVIMPAFSYISAAEATALLGAKPVYVDVYPTSYNINSEKLEEKITKRTKAIIPVSLYGQPADFQTVNKIAKKYNLIVIEDGAQSFGAEQLGQKSCNLTDIGCTSFFPTKPLGCYGDGGAIFTSNEELAKRLRMVSRHGQTKKYHHEIVGINSRLDTLQAAILLPKLEILDWEIERRNNIALKLNDKFSYIPQLTYPKINSGNKSAWAQYTLQSTDAKSLQMHLKNAGVPTFVHYPKTLDQQPAVNSAQKNLHVSHQLAKSVFSLPVHAYLNETQIDQMTTSIQDFYDLKA